MTVEEKANNRYPDVSFSIDVASEDVLSTNEIRLIERMSYIEGHNEAMRWRDPNIELPEYKGEYFQILLKNPNGIYFLREIFSQDNIDYLLLVEGDYCVWRPIE